MIEPRVKSSGDRVAYTIFVMNKRRWARRARARYAYILIDNVDDNNS